MIDLGPSLRKTKEYLKKDFKVKKSPIHLCMVVEEIFNNKNLVGAGEVRNGTNTQKEFKKNLHIPIFLKIYLL